MKKYKAVKIFCPQCNSHTGTYDGRSTIDKIVKCKKCNKLVIYRTETGKTENRPVPKKELQFWGCVCVR